MTPCVTSLTTNQALAMIDILGVIFEACLALNFSVEWQSDVRQKMALGAVCRCWRLVLESLPALWSCIILVPRMPQYYIDKVFRLAKATPKRLRIDIYSELAPTFLPSIAALLVATAETVTHLCVQYSSYSTWDGFINHISAIHSQPRFTSLQQFSATTPIPLWSELDADLPHRFPGYAPNLQHLLLHGLPLSSFAVGPNINSLALTNLNSVYDDATSTVFALCLLDTLRHTPRLSMLMVGAPPESTLHLNASNSLAPVVLPHLHTFSFLCMLSSTHRCGFLASLIVAPQLQTLSVGLANVPNTKDFISLNSSKISVIAGLHLLGNTSAYLEFTSGGAQKLLSSLTGSNLRSIDFLDLVGSFDFDADHIVDVQRGLLEILTHALSLPAIRLLVIPPLFLPPHPGSRRSLMSSLFDDLPRDSKAKHILEAHAVCLSSEENHSNCGLLWSWEHRTLTLRSEPSHYRVGWFGAEFFVPVNFL